MLSTSSHRYSVYLIGKTRDVDTINYSQLDNDPRWSPWSSTVQYSTAQHSTVQYSTVQLQVDHSPGRHGGEVRARGHAVGAEGGLGGGPGAGVAGRPTRL